MTTSPDDAGGPGGVLDDCVSVDLRDDAQAPGQARRIARETLGRWQLAVLADRVLLVVSELVTNSVRYGRPPLRMVLTRIGRTVRVDVHDTVPTAPRFAQCRTAADDAESGRGLLLVTEVADDVGVEQVPGDGKHVYASFHP